jgi:hypothetical protein
MPPNQKREQVNHTMKVVLPQTTEDVVSLLQAMAHSMFMDANDVMKERKVKEDDPFVQEKLDLGEVLKKASEELALRKRLRQKIQNQQVAQKVKV